MKKIKLAVTALIIAVGSFAAFAFTKVDTKKAPTLYWVTGVSGSQFNVSTNPADARGCDGEDIPCRITTTETPVSGKLTQAQMDSPNTIVHNYQDL